MRVHLSWGMTRQSCCSISSCLSVSMRRAASFPHECPALSPQYGFASSVIGNVISVVDQPANLWTIAETAATVWT